MKIKSSLMFSILSLALVSCGGSGGSAGSGSISSQLDKGKELASLGNAEVKEGYIELLARVNPNIEGQLKTPAGKKRLVDSLLEQELLFQESQKRGVDKLPQVQEKAALYQRVIYAQALLDDEVEKKSKGYYDENKDKEFARVEVAHILIRIAPAKPTLGKDGKPQVVDNKAAETEALNKAKEAKAKLDSGTSWQEVVDIYSDDKATKAKGGDLGAISKGDRRVSRLDWNEIVEAAFKMKVNDISEPIKAKDGYHIIKVTKEPGVAPFEEVQNSIKFKLRSQVKNELLANLTKGKTTEYEDADLKAAAQAPAPAAPMAPGAAPQAPEAQTALGNKTPPATPSSDKKPATDQKPTVQPPPGAQIIQTPSGPQVVKTKSQTTTPESAPSK